MSRGRSTTRWLRLDPRTGGQSAADRCFIGGRPVLPAGMPIPDCALCGDQQTFFLQFAFPRNHFLSHHALAVFQCTCCMDENRLFPLYVDFEGVAPGDRALRGDFFEGYDPNFRFVLFDPDDGASPRADYRVKVAFSRLRDRAPGGRVVRFGNRPEWMHFTDQSPGHFEGQEMKYAFQILGDLDFSIEADAPRQAWTDHEGVNYRHDVPWYSLFAGNRLTCFVNHPYGGAPHVYVVSEH